MIRLFRIKFYSILKNYDSFYKKWLVLKRVRQSRCLKKTFKECIWKFLCKNMISCRSKYLLFIFLYYFLENKKSVWMTLFFWYIQCLILVIYILNNCSVLLYYHSFILNRFPLKTPLKALFYLKYQQHLSKNINLKALFLNCVNIGHFWGNNIPKLCRLHRRHEEFPE